MNGWSKWDGTHDVEDQKKRLSSAKAPACTPLNVSRGDCSGSFSGSHGTYETTLTACTCGDFVRRKLPCKHIYRLAIELGVLNDVATSDASKIKSPIPYGYSLEEAVRFVEQLPDDSQRVLMNTIRNKLYQKREKYRQKKNDGVAELIASGLAEDAGAGAVSVSPSLLKSARKLCTYLLRKYENDQYLDPETGEIVSYPHGASFTSAVAISVSGSSVSACCEFPDDEVTQLLDLYHHNRCRAEEL